LPFRIHTSSLFFFYLSRPHLHLHSFPTRRSSDLSSFPVRAGAPRGFPYSLDQGIASQKPSGICRSIVGDGSDPLSLAVFACVGRSEEHTSELQSRGHLVCRLLLEKKKKNI